MNKDNVLFTIIGLLAGLIIGFMATNSFNRNSILSQNSQTLSGSNGQMLNQQEQGAAMPAVADALKVADENPDNFEAQIKAGDMFARISNLEKAITYFERALKIKPNDYKTVVGLGNLSYDREDFEAAQKWNEQALAKKPDDVNVRTDLGLTFFRREPRDINRAIKEYKTSLSFNPNHELTLQNLAVAYAENKDQKGLEETLAKLEKVNPQNQIIKKLKE